MKLASRALGAQFFNDVSRAVASEAYHKAHTVQQQGPARILRQCATVQEARRHVFDYDSATVERHGEAAVIVEELPTYHPTAEYVLAWFAERYPTAATFAALADVRP